MNPLPASGGTGSRPAVGLRHGAADDEGERMTPKDQAREIVRAIIGQEVPVIMSHKDGVHYFGAHAPGTDIAVAVQMHPDGPLAHFARFSMTSDPTDPETARAIFAALCHLGCA